MKKLILFFLIIIVTCTIIKSDIATIKKQSQSIEAISGGVLLDNVQPAQISAKFKNQWGLYNSGENNGVDDDGNGYIDDIHGWDFVNNDNAVFDYSGLDKHGTLTAGIIKIVSENVNVKIIPLKVMEGKTSVNTDILIKAINYAQKMDVKIINCSWQGFKYDKELEKTMKNSDILFICAAGNSSCNVAYIPSYPACYDLPNIISVGSINSKGEYSKFSNYGNKIHVAAPGENVISTIPGNKYETITGTSVAAPFVTGIAAIIKSLFPNLSSQDIARRIKEIVFRIDNLTDKVTTGGIVDHMQL
ncbi:MAG: hypothetical protein FIA99_15740 [Ruminiclostridium sp.]|nr:hypothetical protein [Ruminiclostridium sp.]